MEEMKTLLFMQNRWHNGLKSSLEEQNLQQSWRIAGLVIGVEIESLICRFEENDERTRHISFARERKFVQNPLFTIPKQRSFKDTFETLLIVCFISYLTVKSYQGLILCSERINTPSWCKSCYILFIINHTQVYDLSFFLVNSKSCQLFLAKYYCSVLLFIARCIYFKLQSGKLNLNCNITWNDKCSSHIQNSDPSILQQVIL